MGNNSKVLAMTLLCFLSIALAVEEKVVSSSPPPISPIRNAEKSDFSGAKIPPLMDSSTKTAPFSVPEKLNPSTNGEDGKEGDKHAGSPGPQEKRSEVKSQGPAKDNVFNGSQEILGFRSDNSKNESCGMANAPNLICRKGALVACLLQSEIESAQFFLLVQNNGSDNMNVNLESPSNIIIDSKSLNLPKHSNKKINLTADASNNLIISLNTGEGEDCVLQTKTSSSDWFQKFPAYAAQVRPMHGAYFLFATVIIVGGTWAYCKSVRKEQQIPYQQLEMATPAQSASMAAIETPADSWDQGWDDDWDDEAVVRTKSKQPAENVPSNGVSSRSANPTKDGWEIDWDD